MTCIELRTYLNDYIDGTLPPERRAAVEANLQLCPDCQKELAGLIALASGVAALPKRIEPARDLWPELSEKILTTAQMNQSLETTALAASDEFLDTERFRGIDYGALVLRRNYGAFMARGLGLSIAVIVLLFTSY
ncbi:MAG: zf-HC2 domain-containing protein, partial [Rhizobacter sp.]|nr:zf-HC2 domain-containing protein [Chlorobiales bacterium]